MKIVFNTKYVLKLNNIGPLDKRCAKTNFKTGGYEKILKQIYAHVFCRPMTCFFNVFNVFFQKTEPKSSDSSERVSVLESISTTSTVSIYDFIFDSN